MTQVSSKRGRGRDPHRAMIKFLRHVGKARNAEGSSFADLIPNVKEKMALKEKRVRETLVK